jgi:outer membrane protein OmpA-like peptidoglycan-associated protein
MAQYRRENYNAWTWGIAALIALALLWLWLTGRGPSASCCTAPAAAAAITSPAAPAAATPVAPAPTSAAAPIAVPEPVAAAPAAAPVAALPKPMATLYFATGKFDVPAEANAALGDVVAYLKANPASKAVISGYNDARGDAAMNAELSKNRAKMTRESLKAAGLDEARIEMRKPAETSLQGDAKEARRVEVTIEP